jgi:two-component system response regulator PilR (NtrC family)
MHGSILVVEDEAVPRKNLSRVLRGEGYEVYEAADGQAAVTILADNECDLVLTDLKMPGLDGLGVLRHIQERLPQTFVVLMTAHASVDTAVEALRLGAQDYLLKPLIFEEVLRKVRLLQEHRRLAVENQVLRREVNRSLEATQLIGTSRIMQEIRTLIEKIAPATSTVLITGESGTGKGVVAQAIHRHSLRCDQIFLQVNCGAIPETLLESQLFGHVKGAFTGAISSQAGLFQSAHGGTLFLDEIGEMPLNLQPKLLHAIEHKEILPVGATRPVQVDIRILAATNRDLKQEVTAGHFREDLYYRLNVIGVQVPPLRERREDIPALVNHLIHRHNMEMRVGYRGVDNAAMKILMSLPWRGNVRELDNALERAAILGNGEWITPGHLPDEEQEVMSLTPLLAEGDHLKAALRAYEQSHIEHVLKKTDGDRTRAATLLGLSRSSLYRKMEGLENCAGQGEN